MEKIDIGIIGLDTSHCKAFTDILNNDNNPYAIPGGRVVCAYPGGTDAFTLSRDRVEGFTKDLRENYGIEILPTIAELVDKVDAILLESVDGRQHLEQFRAIAVGKPVYIDKPLACSLAEARAIQQMAVDTKTPLMSCSSLRYAAGIHDLVPAGEQVTCCEAFGPAPLLDDYPGLFWYGIHSAEVLFSIMGEGCEAVQLVAKPDMDFVIGEWQDGRMGMMCGTRFNSHDFGCVVHTSAETRMGVAKPDPPYYAVMLQKVMSFFETGLSPISINETMEIIAFLEAAEISRGEKGRRIPLVQ
jgi:hypothetical protein